METKRKRGRPPKSAQTVSIPMRKRRKVEADSKQKPEVEQKVTRIRGEKMLSKDFLIDLALHIKNAVEPLARGLKGREIVSIAPTGDPTFVIDQAAEKALLSFLRASKEPIAYYSEDAGYSTYAREPKYLLIVDPIDGTRAAKNGFEWCTVSIASTRVIERPTFKDLDNACVVELLNDRIFYAERGEKTVIFENGEKKRAKLSNNTDLEMLSWALTVPGRPSSLIFNAASKLIDLSSLRGAFYVCNSTSYSLTRLVTGQLDACVDIAIKFLKSYPEGTKDKFLKSGKGAIIGPAPYDLCPALLIAEQAGCVFSNLDGESFDNVLLLDTHPENYQTLVAAANPDLHNYLLDFFHERVEKIIQILQKKEGHNLTG